MKFESYDSASEKARFKIVRRDDFKDVEGQIVSANDATGECCVENKGECQTHSFGLNAIRIVRRGR